MLTRNAIIGAVLGMGLIAPLAYFGAVADQSPSSAIALLSSFALLGALLGLVYATAQENRRRTGPVKQQLVGVIVSAIFFFGALLLLFLGAVFMPRNRRSKRNRTPSNSRRYSTRYTSRPAIRPAAKPAPRVTTPIRRCPQCAGKSQISQTRTTVCHSCCGQGTVSGGIAGIFSKTHADAYRMYTEIKCGECEGKGHITQVTVVDCHRCNGRGIITT